MKKRVDPFYRTSAWRELRYAALKRDQWCCTCCGLSVRYRGQSRVDHIIDRRERPDLALALSDLRVLCASCDNKRHAEKGGKHIERPTIAIDGLPDTWRK